MIIYLDQIIISDILVNYIFIKLIKVLFKEKENVLRTILGLMFSVLSLSLYFFFFKYLNILRYFVGIIIGLIVFLKKDIKICIIQIVLYYLLNFSFVGTLVIFNANNTILLVFCVLFIMSLWIVQNYKNIYIKEKTYEYNVRVGNKKILAFLDSGNNSYFEGIPIVYLKDKYKTSEFNIYKSTYIKGLNSIEMFDIYKGPLLLINNKEYYVYYIFIKSLEKEMILNFELGD